MSSPSDLIGFWKYEERSVKPNDPPNPILDTDSQAVISIAAGVNCPQSFDVTVPLKSGSKLELKCVPLTLDAVGRYTLSGSGTDETKSSIGIRLIFNLSVSPPKIFYGVLGSTVEKWYPVAQPNDMGVITGEKKP